MYAAQSSSEGTVGAVFGLLHSVPNLSRSVPDDSLRGELRRMALAALTGPATGR